MTAPQPGPQGLPGFDPNASATAATSANTISQGDLDKWDQQYRDNLNDPNFTTNPQIALMAAKARTNPAARARLGGFMDALELQKQVLLARTSGVPIQLDQQQKSLLAASGVTWQDVDYDNLMELQQSKVLTDTAKNVNKAQSKDSIWNYDENDNILEAAVGMVATGVRNLGKFLVTNPVSQAIFETFHALYQVATEPYRIIAAGFDPDGEAERTADMKANGYDPNSFLDQIQYYYKGEQVYSDTSDLRKKWGDKAVDLAKEFLKDPDATYAKIAALPADQAAQQFQLIKNKDLMEQVDAKHFSPGRDVAGLLGMDPTTEAYKYTSGALDGAVLWFSDPFLVTGRVTNAVRATRYGMSSMADVNRIRELMTGTSTAAKNVQSGWQGFLDLNKAWRAGTEAGDEAGAVAATAAYTQARATYGPGLMKLWDEVAGKRVVTPVGSYRDALGHMRSAYDATLDQNFVMTGRSSAMRSAEADLAKSGEDLSNSAAVASGGTAPLTSVITSPSDALFAVRQGKPIETLDELTSYFLSTNALMRLGMGNAAAKTVLMPGRVSWWMERKGAQVAKRADKANWVDSRKGFAILPMAGETQEAADALANAALRGQADFNALRPSLRTPIDAARRRMERTWRRITTFIPPGHIDLTAAEGTETVRNFARSYMSKADADRYASLYAGQDLAGRLKVVEGVLEQTFHASGIMLTASGREWAESAMKVLREDRRYGIGDAVPVGDDLAHGAMYDSQLATKFTLPDFGELHRMAAKLSLYERYGAEDAGLNLYQKGRDKVHAVKASVLYSEHTDQLMQAFKLSKLLQFATGVRSVGEERLGFIARGEGRMAMIANKGKRQYRKLTEDAQADLKAKTGIDAETLDDMVAALAQRKANMAGTILRSLSLRRTDPMSKITAEDVRVAMADFEDDLLAQHLERLDLNASQLHHYADTATEPAAKEALRRGYQVSPYELKWGEVGIEDGKALEYWAHNLRHRFGKETDLGRIALPHLAGEAPNLPAAMRAIVKHLESDAGRPLREGSILLKYTKNGEAATTPALKAQAIQDHAERVVGDLLHFTTGRGVGGEPGAISDELAKGLAEGKFDPEFLKSIPKESRPATVIGRQYMPNAAPDAVQRGAGAMTVAMSRAYDWMVARPGKTLSREPIFYAHYTLGLKRMRPYQKFLVEQGWKPEIAEQVVKQSAAQAAVVQTAARVDNPALRTQFSVVSRNMWMFERAMEDALRRWGRIIKEDPTVIRKAQLIVEGGIHSGFIDKDPQGNLIFTYPGSSAVLTTMMKAADTLGIKGLVQLPVSAALGSQAIFLNPSLDNPIGFAGSPIITTPFRLFQAMAPEAWAVPLENAQTIVEGQMGANADWWQTWLPGAGTRIIKALQTDVDSQLASAMRNAIIQMDAAGQLPPPGSTHAQIDEFYMRLKNSLRTQIITRTALAMFLPAAPGLPDNDFGAGTPDAEFAKLGLSTLSAEYKKLLGDVGYEKAIAIWQKLHPDKMAYTIGTTQSEAGTFMPVTDTVAKFATQNSDWVNQNKTIAAYFFPNAPGQFSQQAWNAELEMGLRTHKDLKDFYVDVRTKNANSYWHEVKAQYDAEIVKANKAGDKNLAKQLADSWAKKDAEIKATNPLLAERFAGNSNWSNLQADKIKQLRMALQSPDLPKGIPDPVVVAQMLVNYDKYQGWLAQHKGLTDDATKTAKANVEADYIQFQGQLLKQQPFYQSLYDDLLAPPSG